MAFLQHSTAYVDVTRVMQLGSYELVAVVYLSWIFVHQNRKPPKKAKSGDGVEGGVCWGRRLNEVWTPEGWPGLGSIHTPVGQVGLLEDQVILEN